MKSDIDLTSLTLDEFRRRLGELVEGALRQDGCCVLLCGNEKVVTIVDPVVLTYVPDDRMAEALLGSWDDDEILNYLSKRRKKP